MSSATVPVGNPAGMPNLQFVIGDVATFTDPLGGSPVSRIWTWDSFPDTLASGPIFASPTAVSTTIPAFAEHGTYTPLLTRHETDGTTTFQRVVVGCADPKLGGVILPSPGFDPALLEPLSIESAEAGWAGGASTAAGDKFLNAFLRSLERAAIGAIVRYNDGDPPLLLVSDTLYVVDTSGAPVSDLTMPAHPIDGHSVIVKDGRGNAGSNAISVLANSGQAIENPNIPGTFGAFGAINTDGAACRWVWIDDYAQWLVDASFGFSGVPPITSTNTPNTIALRDGSGDSDFTAVRIGTAPYAGGGTLRFAKLSSTKARNNANSADITVWATDTSDILTIGTGAVASVLTCSASAFITPASFLSLGPGTDLYLNPGSGVVHCEAAGTEYLTVTLGTSPVFDFLAAATGGGTFKVAGTTKLQITSAGVGFSGGTPGKPTITGSRGGNAALASLLTALATMGLLVDSST